MGWWLGRCCGLAFLGRMGVELGVGLLRSLCNRHGLVGKEGCGWEWVALLGGYFCFCDGFAEAATRRSEVLLTLV